MSFVTSKSMMENARIEGYAVPAFNVENMEMVQAVLDAAVEMNSPVILQTTPSTVKYANPYILKAIVYEAAKLCPIPVALHLDHGDSFELVLKAVRAGYTSVMIDGSKLQFEDNIAITKKVVEIGKAAQIPVEAELGKVGGKEDELEVSDKCASFTDPFEAKEFVLRTGIDSLAVAIGTAHGFYKGEPKLDFERLSKIRDVVDIMLVLHGASGVPDKDIMKAIELGICKVNFATELRAAMTEGVRDALEDKSIYDPKVYLTKGKKMVMDVVKHKITICGSSNKVV